MKNLGVACLASVVMSFLLLAEPGRALSAETNLKRSAAPNIVILFTDDQGYGDVGCFGAKGFETPHLDQLAKQGRRFTHFYVSQAVCGASRASLLTGCYSNRVSLLGAPGPAATHGIAAEETTIAEMLKQKDYATAIVGKWHLGHHEPFLPLQNGFDQYYGLPYSNDMWPYHPGGLKFPALPLFRDNEIIDADLTAEDQTHLIADYTKEACQFIRDQKEGPFLLYLAHSLPHVPLYGSPEFEGSSSQGRYGDIIQEIDASVGKVLATLDETGVADNTLVIFATDNGPWLSYGNHAGSTGGLREGKGTAWEGGVRVPCIMRWPGKIPADTVCAEPCGTIDVLPTLAAVTECELPAKPIDGLDISGLLTGSKTESPHQYMLYYYGHELRAVRSGPWKLVFPHQYRSLTGAAGRDGKPDGYSQVECQLALYNLLEDPKESLDVQADHPKIVEQLRGFAAEGRTQLGDSLTKTLGEGIRPAGRWRPEGNANGGQ